MRLTFWRGFALVVAAGILAGGLGVIASLLFLYFWGKHEKEKPSKD